jgi:hypothetical protein
MSTPTETGISNPLSGAPAPALPKRVITLTMQGKTYRVHKSRVVIGSVISADIRVTGDGVSPIHAVLELGADGSVTVFDLASDTGVFVNGAKVVTQTLKSGEDITIGRHHLKFALEELDRLGGDAKTRDAQGRKLFMNPNEDIGALLLEDERQIEEIFDYRPSQQLALQVVLSWRGTVLDVEHFTRKSQITIGEDRSNDFGIPAGLSSKRFGFVTQKGAGAQLNLEGGMKGVIQRGGQLRSLSEVGKQVPLEQGDFAKVTLGELDFYLSFTPAPPRLKKSRLFERDPLFFKITFASLLLTALTITALMRLPVDQSLEAEEVPERIATILYQPEKFVPPPPPPAPKPKVETKPQPKVETPPPPKPKPEPQPQKTVKIEVQPKNTPPKPVPKEMKVAETPKNKPQAQKATKAGGARAQNQAKEGEGARAKGAEGARGEKNAPKADTKQSQAFRPSPQGGAGRGAGDSQVVDEGNLDLLKEAGGKVQDLLGNSAAQLGKGGSKLKGFGGFNTQGEGGLALSGTGRGGGGDAASLGGLGKEGRGGGKVGTGMGAAGTGNGIAGGAARVVLRQGGPEETVVMGSIDSDAINAAIMAQKDRFRLCYEKEINAENPPGSGRVSTSFVIASNGRVTDAGIESTTLNNRNTESCILAVIKSIQFPLPQGAGIVQVTYPFKFAPVGK